jgi:hypothetical protein
MSTQQDGARDAQLDGGDDRARRAGTMTPMEDVDDEVRELPTEAYRENV